MEGRSPPESNAFQISDVGLVDESFVHQRVGDLFELDAAYSFCFGHPLEFFPGSTLSVGVQLLEQAEDHILELRGIVAGAAVLSLGDLDLVRLIRVVFGES